MNKPHKHAELIKAWADVEVQDYIAELEAELRHTTMAAEAEAKRVDELTEENARLRQALKE